MNLRTLTNDFESDDPEDFSDTPDTYRTYESCRPPPRLLNRDCGEVGDEFSSWTEHQS